MALVRRLISPEKGRPRWVRTDALVPDLLYLGWGKRDFFSFPRPQHYKVGWSFFLLRAGEIVVTLPREKLILTKGQLLVAGPDSPYGLSQETQRDCDVLVWIWEGVPKRTFPSLERTGLSISPLSSSGERRLALLHEFLRMEILGTSRPSGEAVQSIRALTDLAMERAVSTPVPTEKQIVDIAVKWMKTNLDVGNPVALLTEFLQISQPSLHRIFTRNMGLSPGRVFQQMKLQEARRLVDDEDLLVKEAAFLLGYRHFNDLSRALTRQRERISGRDRTQDSGVPKAFKRQETGR